MMNVLALLTIIHKLLKLYNNFIVESIIGEKFYVLIQLFEKQWCRTKLFTFGAQLNFLAWESQTPEQLEKQVHKVKDIKVMSKISLDDLLGPKFWIFFFFWVWKKTIVFWASDFPFFQGYGFAARLRIISRVLHNHKQICINILFF